MTEPDRTPDHLPFTDDEKRLRKEVARAELMNKLETTNPALHKRITEGTTR